MSKHMSDEPMATWTALYSRYELAAITGVTVEAVRTWVLRDRLPMYAHRLLSLYSGRLSQADWEDSIDTEVDRLKAAERARK